MNGEIIVRDEHFNKVFIGSGLMAELFLNTLINYKGEPPAEFYVLGKDRDRCVDLMHKYQIRATTNFNAFISKAQVVVLAVDVPEIDDIPELTEKIVDKVPPDALINSITPDFKIAQIEELFPEHPVMRLSLDFSAITGNSIGTYCVGSVTPEDTEPVAKFLIGCFGELIEVDDEEEFEKIADIIFAQNCSNYLAINCFINVAIKQGLSPQIARKIATQTYKGVGITLEEKYKDPFILNMFHNKDAFAKGLALMDKFGMAEALTKVHELPPEVIKANLERARDAARAENAKSRFHLRLDN